MNFKIVAIGGTGQMVIHYYLQFYLLGLVIEPFDAVLIDSDQIIPSVLVLQRFFQDLQYGAQRDETLGGDKIPVIETIPIRASEDDTALEALTGRNDWALNKPHPAYAFFNRDTLVQNLKQGLFARPALSSVIAPEALANNALMPRLDSNVVAVSCVIGGTGGGLTAPVLDAVRFFSQRGETRSKIRGVFFGEYFNPKSEVISDDVVRFKSNQLLVLRSIREAKLADKLHSFHIVGGPGFAYKIDRDPQKEKKGNRLPWPNNENHPLWEGAKALEYLLHDDIADANPTFELREIENPTAPYQLSDAKLALQKSLRMAETLIDKRVVLRMCRDPWSRWIWGARFVNVIAHFWSVAIRREGKDAAKDFPERVQTALETIWRGETDKPGLRDVFPDPDQRRRIRPRHIGRANWPQIKEGTRANELFNDVETIARRAAATLLYRVLREGAR